jgi:hypothetical protein
LVRAGGKLLLPIGSHLRYILFMTKSIKDIPKKRGRPATGKDPLVGIRMPPDLISTLDTWAAKNDHTRAAAVRYFVEKGLSKAR